MSCWQRCNWEVVWLISVQNWYTFPASYWTSSDVCQISVALWLLIKHCCLESIFCILNCISRIFQVLGGFSMVSHLSAQGFLGCLLSITLFHNFCEKLVSLYRLMLLEAGLYINKFKSI